MSRITNAPWAALIALGIVVYVDRTSVADRERWMDIRNRLEALPEPVVRVEIGKAKDVLQLGNLAETPPELRRLVVLGNSRARVGLNLRDLEDVDIQLAKLAHAAVSPYVMRTMARDIAAAQPDLVVLMLSEIDTHRPVELVPSACFQSPDALWQLLRTEPSLLWKQRQKLEQVTIGTVLQSYLNGDVLDRSYLNDFREIRTQEPEAGTGASGGKKKPKGRRNRPVPRKQLEVESENARYRPRRIEERDIEPPPIENLDEIRAEFEKFFKRKRVRNSTLNIGYAIQKGAHVQTQMGLIEKTIEILTQAGSKILIVEGPLNPLTNLLYDEESTRAEFLSFVDEMKEKHGVHFQRLEETGPFVEKDFTDLLHLKGTSARKLSAKVKQRIIEVLSP